MTAHERRLLARMAEALDRRLTRKRGDVRHYPEPHCQIGQLYQSRWRPCSPRCAQDRALVAEAEALLAEQAAVQLEMRAS